MSDHFAEVDWRYTEHPEQTTTYNRDHTVTLENGINIASSAAPAFLGNATMSNPETLLLAALASCHMLTFLAITSKRGYQVSHYHDKAEGTLGKNAEGRMALIHCTLKPTISFVNDIAPTSEELQKFHESSHRNCFIANSLSTKVEIIS
ncbi:MAG: OsmC family protein [Arenimonas sp.]|nr:OsmC family protein [Arenimonas sp.]